MEVKHPRLSIGNAIRDHYSIRVVGGVGRQRRQLGLRLRSGEAGVSWEIEIRRDRNILVTPIHRWRMGQRTVELLRTLNLGFAPDHLLHPFFWLNPGSCSLAPAPRSGHGHLEAETISFGPGVSKRVFPLRSHPDQAFVHKLRGAQTAIEHLHSRSAVMPSLVTLPLSQCHQTRGFAESGGCRKRCSSVSLEPWPTVELVMAATTNPVATMRSSEVRYRFMSTCPLWKFGGSGRRSGCCGLRGMTDAPRCDLRSPDRLLRENIWLTWTGSPRHFNQRALRVSSIMNIFMY